MEASANTLRLRHALDIASALARDPNVLTPDDVDHLKVLKAILNHAKKKKQLRAGTHEPYCPECQEFRKEVPV